MPNSWHRSVIGSPSSRRAMKRRRSSITELAFHGIYTSRSLQTDAKGVTHVFGTKCHLCLRPHTLPQAFADDPISPQNRQKALNRRDFCVHYRPFTFVL